MEDSEATEGEEVSMIPFTDLTETFLDDSLERNMLPEGTPENKANARKLAEAKDWKCVQRLAATVCVLYGKQLRPTDMVAVMGAICLKLGWQAAQDVAAARHACDEIGYLMSDEEMEALRKELRTK
jgi:hypothetical protein